MLVFFYDILIYSETLEDHVTHLKQVLMIMQQQSLFPKNSKKSMVVQQWPIPKTIKQLRGFLRLAGYYKRFVKCMEILLDF